MPNCFGRDFKSDFESFWDLRDLRDFFGGLSQILEILDDMDMTNHFA